MKATESWVYCDNDDSCGQSFNADAENAITAARVRGWRFFEGVSPSGIKINSVLCPSCVGLRKRGPKVEPLKQEGLW